MMYPDETNINAGEGMTEDYVEAIKSIRDNSVSKDSYNALKEENKKLLQTLVSGGTITPDQIEAKRSVEDIRKELFNSDLTNLDFITKALELRNRVMEEGGEDPFVPTGKKISADPMDYASAQKVADAFQSCVEYANGDPEIFTMELQRITKDTLPRR